MLSLLCIDLRKDMTRQHDQDEWTLNQLRKALRGEIRVLEAGRASVFIFAWREKRNLHS